jgi:hypothetical protein
VQRRAWWR